MGGTGGAAGTLLAGFGSLLLLVSLALPWFSVHRYFRTDDVIDYYDALPGNGEPSLHDRLPGGGWVLEVTIAGAGTAALAAAVASDITGHRFPPLAATVAASGGAAMVLVLVSTVAALHTGRPGPGVEHLRAGPAPGVALAWLCATAVTAGGVVDLGVARSGA